jgi:hypothetical protein
VTILFSVAGLRAAGLLRPAHHSADAFPFAVASPARLLLLAMMAVGFLAAWHLVYRR